MSRTILLIILILFCIAGHTQEILFDENFESGLLNNWTFWGPSWSIIEKDDNNLISCNQHSWAHPNLPSGTYKDFILDFDFILEKGVISIWFRHTEIDGEIQHSYKLDCSENLILLEKWYGDGSQKIERMVEVEISNILGKQNHLRFNIVSNHIQIFFNDELVIDYEDLNNPHLFCRNCFALFAHDGSLGLFDNVVLKTFKEAQGAKWVKTGGPWGGIGYDIRIDPDEPNVMYVTDQWAGNHKSINGGKTWYANNSGIQTVFGSTGQSIPIFCLTIDPNNTDNVWCGTANFNGLYLSSDRGEHWELRNSGIPSFPCGMTYRGIGIRPDSSSTIFCSLEIPMCKSELPSGKEAGARGKIFKSVDFGQNWYEVLDSDALVRHILFSPQNPDIMYASTGIFDRDCKQEEGVWKSMDGGESWYHANSGLTDLTIGGLSMSPDNPDILWACTGREEPFGGDNSGEIFLSTDGAQSWKKMYPKSGNDAGWVICSITASPVNSNTVYASAEDFFYVSHDFGLTWKKYQYNIPGVYTGIPVGIAAHPEEEEIVFINSYSGGVFGSQDGGRSWKSYNIGYTGAEEMDVIIHPNNPLMALASGRSGIASTNNGGATWDGAGVAASGNSAIGNTPIAEQTSLACNYLNSDGFYCGAHWSSVLLSTSDRLNWRVLYDFYEEGVRYSNNNKENHGIGAIHSSPIDSSIIYVGIRTSTIPLILDRPEQPFDPTKVSHGVFKSTNGGTTWDDMNNGLDSTTKNIQTIAIHPQDPDIIYIGIYGSGVYKTVDGGENWSSVNTGIFSFLIAHIIVDPIDFQTVYAGAEDGGFYKSTDGGHTWVRKMVGMDPEASIRSIVVDPTNNQNLFVGDWHTGVYHSDDGGESWNPFNEGLSTRSVQDLDISSDGKTLYLATQGEGVFRLSYEDTAPQTQYVYPENRSPICLSSDDSLSFIIGSIDLNGDSLQFQWFLNNVIIQGAIGSTHNLLPSELSEGYHSLHCDISDEGFTTMVKWEIAYTESVPGTNIYDTICYGESVRVGDVEYSEEGQYSVALQNQYGCDSVVNLFLKVSEVNTDIIAEDAVIKASASNAEFQWLDCNNNYSPFENETDQSFSPTSRGSYAVEVRQNGCIDTSSCYAVLGTYFIENSFGEALKIYPNPTSGNVKVELDDAFDIITVKLESLDGQTFLIENYYNVRMIDLSIAETPGLYLLELLTADGEKAIFRIIKN